MRIIQKLRKKLGTYASVGEACGGVSKQRVHAYDRKLTQNGEILIRFLLAARKELGISAEEFVEDLEKDYCIAKDSTKKSSL